MPGVLVDLDSSRQTSVERRRDRVTICALVIASVAFAALVSLTRPPGSSPVATAADRGSANGDLPSVAVPRGAVLHPLQLPAGYANVDLSAMPDRLANEASPATLRGVVWIRGAPGVASVEGPAVIMWTEDGVAYWLRSPNRTTDELIRIADTLR